MTEGASQTMTPYLRKTHVRWLTVMLEHYSGEETSLRKRLDGGDIWGDGHANEWRRYQAESAALRAAIAALQLSDETPQSASKDIVERIIRTVKTWPVESPPTGTYQSWVAALVAEIEQLRYGLANSRPSETPVLPGELEQLRRIDRAARKFVNACEPKVRIPNEPFAELCNALFYGDPLHALPDRKR